MFNSPVAKLALVAAVLYGVYRFGPAEVKGAALGVAGYLVLNQIPVLRDAAAVRLVA